MASPALKFEQNITDFESYSFSWGRNRFIFFPKQQHLRKQFDELRFIIFWIQVNIYCAEATIFLIIHHQVTRGVIFFLYFNNILVIVFFLNSLGDCHKNFAPMIKQIWAELTSVSHKIGFQVISGDFSN